jgi:predicted AlkP superfamily phosphohydrolase/phosphomutase
MTNATPRKGARQRVLLIGLDSADAELIERWMSEGHMPNFVRLQRDGMWRRVGTTAEIMHVSAWPTLYTGTTPGQHGMYHAYQVRAGNQFIQRTQPEWCGQAPFWKHLDEAGRKCVVFDAFMDYRLPDFKGVQILEYGTWTWFGEPASNPRSLLGEIKRTFGPYPAPEHANQVQVPNDTAGFRDQLVAGAKLKGRICQHLMKQSDWDLLFVTFGEPHGAGHYLWHIGDAEYPLHAQSGARAGENFVRDVYTAVDAAIGAIVDSADDNTSIIVTSGDGMGPNYSGCHHMPLMLHRMGLFRSANIGDGKAAAKPAKKGVLQSIRQAIPLELRQAVTRCMPRSMRYNLEMKWVNSAVRWGESKVFCVPNSNEAYFRINLKGREPQGIVASGAEYADILASLTAELGRLVNPANSQPAAERVTKMDEVFRGPRRPDLPDAVISWNEAARILNELESPTAGRIAGPPGHGVSPFYTGNHRAHAFVLARGAAANAGTRDRIHILDIAPTILSLLGVDPPRHYEGRPWGVS